ncbi:MAG: peptidoglycan-binding domain-containing protein [Cyanobacteria bacterium P01_A01_bin.105]
MNPEIECKDNPPESNTNILPQQETLSLVREYCFISSLEKLSDREADRLYQIISMAEDDSCLEFWLNEADHFLAHELGLSGKISHPVETANQKAELLEHLDLWSHRDSGQSSEAIKLVKEIRQALISDSRAIQKSLKRHGFDPGPIDGVIGPRTKDAIMSFQQTHKIPLSGIIDDDTETELDLEN